MGSEWTEVTLGEVIHVKHGYAFKSKLYSQEKRGRPVVVGIGNFKYTGGFRFESTKRNEYTADYPAEFVLLPGEILLVMTCQTSGGEILGIPGRIPDDGSIYLHNQRLGKVVVKQAERSCEDFLYWLFLSRPFNQHLYLTATGTKILHTAPKRIEAFKCPLPPLPEQKRIAGVLGALDDKIELNRKMNQTLEEMAQALFKSWFIDFDGHDPVDLVDSELGPIPRGWEIGSVAQVLEFNPRTKLRKGVVAKFVDMKALPTQGCAINSYIEKALKSGGAKFRKNDTLLARITPCLENGKTGLVDFLNDDEVGFGSTEFIVIRPNQKFGYTWVYCLARSKRFRAHAISNMVGSSGRQRVPVDCFHHFEIPIPDGATVREFHIATNPLFERIRINANESHTLAQLRDTLLPKLISGEIRVPEAERAVEAVV